MTASNILLLGVGGQGILLASDILVNLGQALDLDVTTSEIHGMAQRGGSVESHVRLGRHILSPLIPKGQADVMISMEQCEPLRYLNYPKSSGTILVSNVRVIPPSVTAGTEIYPDASKIKDQLEAHFFNVFMVDVKSILKYLGSDKIGNVVLLGCLSQFLPFGESVWRDVIKETLPAKIVSINLDAFLAGRSELAGASNRKQQRRHCRNN